MKFRVGDMVMHWNHGLGQITGLEERKLTGQSQLYYALKIRDLSIWVPADGQAAGRMRAPTSSRSFKKLFAVLGGPAATLPDDRRERKTQLHTRMSDGTADSICQVIRDLTRRGEGRTLNDDDRLTLDRARALLVAEWAYALDVPPAQAEHDLHAMLKPGETASKGTNGKKKS